MAYFSLAKSTAKVAQALATKLSDHFDMNFAEIISARNHGYRYWLFLSFLPNVGAAINPVETSLEKFDVLVLGTPKWTFNCPPVTQYLKLLRGTENKPAALYVVHKGFDEIRYLQSLKRKMLRKHLNVIATATFLADKVGDGSYEPMLNSFAADIIKAISGTGR